MRRPKLALCCLFGGIAATSGALMGTTAAPAALPVNAAPNYFGVSYANGHPVNAFGYVTDGTPQLDDAHCVGNVFQQFACLAARHPGLAVFLSSQYTPPGGAWACIRARESGGNYAENTGNGYYGAYQFLPRTWDHAVTGAGFPLYANGRADLAPPDVQDAAAVWLQSQDGWGPWSTRYACGV